MQESFGMILLAIVNGQPPRAGLLPLLKLSSSTASKWCGGARSSSCARPKSASTFCSASKKRRAFGRHHQADPPQQVSQGSARRLDGGLEFTERQAQAILDLPTAPPDAARARENHRRVEADSGRDRRAEGNPGEREKTEGRDIKSCAKSERTTPPAPTRSSKASRRSSWKT